MNDNAKVIYYMITKSLICSRVKGVYKEVDEILSGSASEVLVKKYWGFGDMMQDMSNLAKMLKLERAKLGADTSNNEKRKFGFEDDKLIYEVEEISASEIIIEEFMVLANRLVASYFEDNCLPLIYRVQEAKKTRAGYDSVKRIHASLALTRYTHFTSPIRRLADLKVHQVLSAHLNGASSAEIRHTFAKEIKESAELATSRENRAEDIVKHCNNVCAEMLLSALTPRELTADVVGLNYKKCPIFMLRDYKLCVNGRTRFEVNKGQKVTVMLSFNECINKFEAVSYKIVA